MPVVVAQAESFSLEPARGIDAADGAQLELGRTRGVAGDELRARGGEGDLLPTAR